MISGIGLYRKKEAECWGYTCILLSDLSVLKSRPTVIWMIQRRQRFTTLLTPRSDWLCCMSSLMLTIIVSDFILPDISTGDRLNSMETNKLPRSLRQNDERQSSLMWHLWYLHIHTCSAVMYATLCPPLSLSLSKILVRFI